MKEAEVEPTMDVQNVARAVAYMASLALDANVQSVTAIATKMPFVGRGTGPRDRVRGGVALPPAALPR